MNKTFPDNIYNENIDWNPSKHSVINSFISLMNYEIKDKDINNISFIKKLFTENKKFLENFEVVLKRFRPVKTTDINSFEDNEAIDDIYSKIVTSENVKEFIFDMIYLFEKSKCEDHINCLEKIEDWRLSIYNDNECKYYHFKILNTDDISKENEIWKENWVLARNLEDNTVYLISNNNWQLTSLQRWWIIESAKLKSILMLLNL